MGARATRIVREELLIPPEFRDIQPKEHQAARVGGARIQLKVAADGTTGLGASYHQVPVCLMPPFDLDGEPASLLYLINLTAGLMDGDGHLMQIEAGPGSRAVVTGQSATRIHPAVSSYATQQWEVRVDEGACLVVLPGPAIPFQGARYFQRGRVELAETARVIWGDLWLAGRYDRGELSERFRFDRIVQDFEARRAGRLVYRDRFCWDGPWTPDEVNWHFGDHLASASLFIAGPVPEGFCEPDPEPNPNLRRSLFRLDTGESCMRWCGTPAAVTADMVRAALTLASAWTMGPGSAPWLLDSTELSPNHWFSVAPRRSNSSAAP